MDFGLRHVHLHLHLYCGYNYGMNTCAYATRDAYGCDYRRLQLGSVVQLRGSHGIVKLRCSHMVRLRDYGTPTEGSRSRRDYGWVLLRLRLRRNYGGLLRRSCGKEEA